MIENFPERYLQKLIRLALADSTTIWSTTNGQRCQFLSPGEWNFDAGPDFLRMAAIVDGHIHVGHGEVHRHRSEWHTHRHKEQAAHQQTLFHFFLIDDAVPASEPPFSIHIPPEHLQPFFEQDQQMLQQRLCDLDSLEILQEYAYRRVMRKADAAYEMLEHADGNLEAALQSAMQQFFQRHSGTRRRPGGLLRYQQQLCSTSTLRPWLSFLQDLATQQLSDDALADRLTSLLRTSLAGEGKGTRLELMVNVLLPMAFAVASEEQKNLLLMWFWALKAPHRYGALVRRFPTLPQQYVWQQQGMLEYLRECRYGRERCAELLLPYLTAADSRIFAHLPSQWFD